MRKEEICGRQKKNVREEEGRSERKGRGRGRDTNRGKQV